MKDQRKALAIAAWNSIVCGEDCPVPWYSPKELAECMEPYDADYVTLADPETVRALAVRCDEMEALVRALVYAARPVANRLWETGSSQPAEVILLGERIQAAEASLEEHA